MSESDISIKKIIELWRHCKCFIKEQSISCPETIYQCDWVIENAYKFIEDIADIVGYDIKESESD